MSKRFITLYCRETPGLKLGPEAQIVFVDGFADVDTETYPDWEAWVHHPGTPFVRVLDAGEVTSAIALGFTCDVDGLSFTTEAALNAHLLTHRRVPPAVTAAAVAAAAEETAALAAISAAAAQKQAEKEAKAAAAPAPRVASKAPAKSTSSKPPTAKQIAAREKFAQAAKDKAAAKATATPATT